MSDTFRNKTENGFPAITRSIHLTNISLNMFEVCYTNLQNIAVRFFPGTFLFGVKLGGVVNRASLITMCYPKMC
jgi:hypothetical protein